MALVLLSAQPIFAQVPSGAPGDDPAVRLAANMRVLAQNPRSISALTGAGESALAVGDADAAFNFLSRAEELSPTDGRIKSLLGSVLVQMERPADAQLLFAQALQLGIPEIQVRKDRGLAFDLVGDQKSAQRDYAVLLRDHDDDEVTRRYALSLAISGERDKALSLLDPLLRRRDQAAWRSRTFVLAMSGSMREADDIAAQVMPSDGGASLKPFLRKIAVLGPADKARAVNFGTMPAGDAGYAAYAPPVVASAPTPPAQIAARPEEKQPSWSRRSRPEKANVQVAVATPTQMGPLAPPPERLDAPAPSAMIAPNFTTTLPPKPQPAPPSQTAAVSAPVLSARVGQRIGPVDPNRLPPELRPLVPSLNTPSAPDTSSPSKADVLKPAAPAPTLTKLTELPKPDNTPPTIAETRAAIAAAVPAAPVQSAPSPAINPTSAASAPSAAFEVPSVAIAKPVSKPAELAVLMPKAPAASEQPPLASPAVASLPESVEPAAGITATELPPSIVAATPTPTPDPGVAEIAAPTADKSAEAAAALPEKPAPVADAPPKPQPTGLASILSSLAPEEERAAGPLPTDREIRALRLAAKKKADAQSQADAQQEAAKAEAEKKKADEAAEAKRNPARSWVQVATGANKGGLPGTWRSLKEKAPKALAGLAAWSVPFRSTNRLLVGPVKSGGDARSLINALAKEGITATSYSSEAGQEIARIGK